MAIFDLDGDQGSWFDLDTGGKVRLRTISFDDWKEIDKATKKKAAPEYPKLEGRHERFQPDIIDEEKRTEMIWDRTIVAWEGLFDKNKKPIPCTKEWKLKLLTMKSAAFRNFYNAKMAILIEAESKQGAESEKNS